MIKSFHFFPEHRLHSAMVSPNHALSYLHIPVNASSWGKQVFARAGFRPNRAPEIPDSHRIIVWLRDPVERWLSGLATWLTYRLPQHTGLDFVRNNLALLDTIFDTVRLDDHTERQAFFIHALDWDRCDFWYINSDFRSEFCAYFAQRFGIDITDHEPQNASSLSNGKSIPRQYFRSVLLNNPAYLARVCEFFESDRDLIKQVQFANCQTPILLGYDS